MSSIVKKEDGGLSMINYIVENCPSCGQWEYTHDRHAARGGIRHLMLMPERLTIPSPV